VIRAVSSHACLRLHGRNWCLTAVCVETRPWPRSLEGYKAVSSTCYAWWYTLTRFVFVCVMRCCPRSEARPRKATAAFGAKNRTPFGGCTRSVCTLARLRDGAYSVKFVVTALSCCASVHRARSRNLCTRFTRRKSCGKAKGHWPVPSGRLHLESLGMFSHPVVRTQPDK
jgi:hypothetical protein